MYHLHFNLLFMGNFFDKSEGLSLEDRIERLDNVIAELCDRFDGFEAKLLDIKNLIHSTNNLQLMQQECTSTNNADEINRLQKQGLEILQMEDDAEKDVTSEIYAAEETDTSEHFVTQIKYCGQPAGSGFEVDNITEEKGIRSLYAIEFIDKQTAFFYPLEEKILRFKNGLTSLLIPVCDIDNDLLECDSFEVDRQNYGILTLEDNNYWKVTKKCLITCVK